jgi:hypothetical protein
MFKANAMYIKMEPYFCFVLLFELENTSLENCHIAFKNVIFKIHPSLLAIADTAVPVEWLNYSCPRVNTGAGTKLWLLISLRKVESFIFLISYRTGTILLGTPAGCPATVSRLLSERGSQFLTFC